MSQSTGEPAGPLEVDDARHQGEAHFPELGHPGETRFVATAPDEEPILFVDLLELLLQLLKVVCKFSNHETPRTLLGLICAISNEAMTLLAPTHERVRGVSSVTLANGAMICMH